MPFKQCEWCHRTFFTLPSQIRVGKGRFCSKQCTDFWQSRFKTVGGGSLERKNAKKRARRKNPDECHIERARDVVKRAVKSGKLIRQPCEVCGELKAEAHHDDYRKPLDVRWLCQRHHRAVDLALGIRVI